VYREMKLKDVYDLLVDSTKTTGGIMIIIGAATLFSYICTVHGISKAAQALLLSIAGNKYVFLLIVNIAILILGMFIDTSVIQVVFVPILLPIAKSFGIDLVHFGLVVIFNMMIGLSTPPFGMLLFITSGVSGTPLKDVIKEIMWPLLTMLIVLVVITYIPEVVLFLPRALMGYAG
jgi:tripartite ATP-independent transporter DctM subunit